MIEVIQVSKQTNGREILRDVSLRADAGRILALLGSSGAGKTSLLRIIAGLDVPACGEVRMAGRTVSGPGKWIPPARRNISLIFQDLALWPHMSVRRHIEFVLKRERYRSRDDASERVERLLDMMHLTPHQRCRPDELSGGERQRLAIARALAADPEYLLMDEPFSNLDDLLKRELMNITLSLKRENQMTIIYVTHNMEEALFLADHISIIDKGRIVRTFDQDEVGLLSREDLIRHFTGGKESR